jgi:hypothetical protein
LPSDIVAGKRLVTRPYLYRYPEGVFKGAIPFVCATRSLLKLGPLGISAVPSLVGKAVY